MSEGRPLYKLVERDTRVAKLTLELAREVRRREHAEREASRFHALLIAERVRNLPLRDID